MFRQVIVICFHINMLFVNLMQMSENRRKQVSGKLERMINYRIFMAILK
ncbi:hypothetical protein M087_0564 [Bacteroides fragilis str. S23 R14]|nr:hypothetical protein M087_0564 [Bacteroides fragilis str. S23 R14]EYA68043.1 hypothetical protein M139_0609 [Bacteroides fragilis str. S23L24]